MKDLDTTSSASRQGGPGHALAAPRKRHDPPTGWRLVLDLDFLYKWATLFVIPAYAVTAQFRSQIFVLYAILFVLKVRKSGYIKCGLEYYFAAAVLGLAASYIGVWDGKIVKDVLQAARTLCLPLLMCQYKPIRKLENALACVFTGLAIYGLARLHFAPLVTGYAQDRPYCFSDFFMHSSVIAFSGYLFFLLMFIRKRGRGWKLLSAANALAFALLIVLHHVRASYLAFLILTPAILLFEFRKKAVVSMAGLLLCAAALAGGLHIARPAVMEMAGRQLCSIADRSNGSNRGRMVFWKKAVQVLAENPVNGMGYRRFNRRHVDINNPEHDWSFWHAHSEFFGMLAETGLVGIVAWLAFKMKLLVTFFRQRGHWIGAFMLYLFLAFEIHNLFECYLYERTAYIYVFLLFGLGMNQFVRKRGAQPCSEETRGAALFRGVRVGRMNAGKVSVVVPFYNAGAFLGRALESIAASTHENIEALLIDDCSADRSEAVARAFSGRDARFRYFRNPENRGVSFCRNRGLDEATGDFVLFVDSDDGISSDWIGNLLEDAAATGAEIVIGRSRRVQGGAESDYRMKGLARRGSLMFETVVFKDNSVVWNKLYSAALLKRECIRFEESLCIGEDLLFNFRAMGRARGIYYNDRGYYYYRADNEVSIMRSSTPAKRLANLSRLLHLLVEYSGTMKKKNRTVFGKVARDILMTHYRFPDAPLDGATMELIRGIDRFLPFRVRFSVFRKAARGILSTRWRRT